jgi:myo-inositol-1(or 4)-monophosphatase
MSIHRDEMQVRLNVARLAATMAGQIQLRATDTSSFVVETKSSATDLVTSVDRACDQAIRDILTSFYPKEGLLTEETYRENTEIDLNGETGTWVVDPLDGTTNFAHGFPYYSVSVAFVRGGQPLVAAVFDPNRGDLFTAVRGGGAYLNDQPIHTSRTPKLEKALLSSGFPANRSAHLQESLAVFEGFMTRCRSIRRAGSAALDLCYVAAGRLDGFWLMQLSPWDVAAGMLIAAEAGGRITTLHGEPLQLSQRRIDILASNGQPALHQEMLAVCRQTLPDNMAPRLSRTTTAAKTDRVALALPV